MNQDLFVEGYLDKSSVLPGERVRLHASASVRRVTVRVVREGATEREILPPTPIEVGEHGVPAESWARGAGWPACWEWVVPGDLETGVYRVELAASGEVASGPTRWAFRRAIHPIMLVVRSPEPGRRSRVLLQLATNTYAAYNPWGGKSTYAYNSSDNRQSPRVSLMRPGHGHFGGTAVGAWELPFIHWCDRNGIALDLATNHDLHTWPDGFDRYRLMLSVGHDEYWSAGMRDHLETFLDRGGNAAFFSGNSVCWCVRYEDDGRTMVAYKEHYRDDPLYNAGRLKEVSTLWSHPMLARPENTLTGVGFRFGGYHRSHGAYMDGSGAFTVRRADHWALEGTGLKPGDTFGGARTIVGYECDGCEWEERGGLPFPTGRDGTPKDFLILAQAPAVWTGCVGPVFDETCVTKDGRATLGLYQRKGCHGDQGIVFTAGTTDWSHGLGHDPIVDRITRNVLGRLG